MDTTNLIEYYFEIAIIVIAVIIVVVDLWLQKKSFNETKNKIKQLSTFFPTEGSYNKKETSITKEVLESQAKLHNFIINPPAKHTESQVITTLSNGDSEEETIEYSDLTLIEVRQSSEPFGEVIYETNAYLCKNVGTSADFSILQDICERKIEALREQISSTINVPLYLGLAGTFIGIIVGLTGIVFNVEDLFSGGNTAPLRNLLIGVVIAMIASLTGLGLMIWNSAISYKRAIGTCEKNKNSYYDFLRRELMPTLSNSMASSLNSLKGVLGAFIGKFGHNLDAYVNSAELLNDNIEKQHLLLVEINQMREKQVAVQIAQTFKDLKDSADSLSQFRDYQDDLNATIQEVKGAVDKIDEVIDSFGEFTTALKVVVANQNTASELQTQFKAAIEKNFPTGSDTREMYRQQFDELTSDARTVSEELNKQLQSSTEYIQGFVNDNKAAFSSLSQLNDVLDKLVEYSNIQASCYKDLKQEINNLKQEQITSQKNSAQLNSDLLTAVKEMIGAIKSMKN